MFSKKETPEYLEKKNLVMLILYNTLSLILGICFMIEPVSKTNNVIFYSVAGSLVGLGIICLLLVMFLYKSKVVIHFKKKYNLGNKVISYLYLSTFAVLLISLFLKKKFTEQTNTINIIIWVFGGLLILVAISALILNSYVTIKEKLPESLDYYLSQKKNQQDNQDNNN